MPYTLFLSHNSADISVVREIKRRSEAAGLSVYMYEDDVQAGTSLASKLTEAIRNCDGVVAILTKNSAPRPAVQQEIGAAVALGKRVFALIEPGVDPATLTLLQGLEYIKLELEQINDALVALQSSITQHQSAKQQKLILAVIVFAAIVGLLYLANKE